MKLNIIFFIAITVFVPIAQAEPTTGPLKIIQIRPYNNEAGPGAVYLHMNQTSVCDTSVYKIDSTFGGSKEIVSTALSAFMTNKDVRIEVVNTGCTGWGSTVQSLYLVK